MERVACCRREKKEGEGKLPGSGMLELTDDKTTRPSAAARVETGLVLFACQPAQGN